MVDIDNKAALVEAANEAGRNSRRAGAPTLTVDSDRLTLIAWLKWNDRNGDFDDPYVFHEGPDGLLPAGWYVSTSDDRVSYADTAFGEADARSYAAEMTSPIADLWLVLAEMLETDGCGHADCAETCALGCSWTDDNPTCSRCKCTRPEDA